MESNTDTKASLEGAMHPDHGLHLAASEVNGSMDLLHVDPELERKTSRKFDLCLLPQMALLTIFAYLDRTNIGLSTNNWGVIP